MLLSLNLNHKQNSISGQLLRVRHSNTLCGLRQNKVMTRLCVSELKLRFILLAVARSFPVPVVVVCLLFGLVYFSVFVSIW